MAYWPGFEEFQNGFKVILFKALQSARVIEGGSSTTSFESATEKFKYNN
jgi:hypothetical protein